MSNVSGTVYLDKDKNFPQTSSSTLEITKPKERNDLDDLIAKSKKIIYEVKSVFPFDLFPNSVTICLDKVIFKYRGFATNDEFPILIDNITGIRVMRTLLFSSLNLETFGFKANPEPIKYLRHIEARLARRYVLGLIECKKAGIDLTKYEIKEIREKLKEIGMVRDNDKDSYHINRHKL